MKYIRDISSNEQLYLDMQDFTSTYGINFLFKIKRIKNIKKIEQAINAVVNNNKGSNVFLRNGKYYLNDDNIKINIINDDSDDVYNLDILKTKLDYEKESLKVYMINNKKDKYLFFQFSHAVMDGKGALLFIENLMSYLKDEELIICSNRLTEKEYLKDLEYNKNKVNKLPYIIHPKSKKISEYKIKWRMIDIDGYIPALVAKIAYFLKKEFSNDTVQYMIPTDIRRHNKEENFIGNLTLPIFLEAKDNETYQMINGKLLYSLKNKEELNMNHASYFGYEKFPKFIRNLIVKTGTKLTGNIDKFSIGAIISFLGRVNLESFSNKYLDFSEFISLPTHQPFGAFSLVLIEYNNKTRISLAYYENQFDDEYILELLEKLKYNLVDNIYNFNNTVKKYDTDYINLFKEVLNNNGEDIAVIDEKKEYTYNDLLNNIKKYIKYFKENKIHSQDTVILYIERSFEFVSAYMACTLSGVIFIPIDKTIAKDRFSQIVELSKCKVILTDDTDFEGLNYNFKNIFDIDDNVRDVFIDMEYKPNNILYKIYTSGTTGVPKAVPISNKNFNNFILWIKDVAKTKNKIVMPLFTSLSVDLTMPTLYLPLICGGTIKTYKGIFNSNIMKRIVNDKDINVIKGTPTHFSFVKDGNYKNKEVVIIGGEKLSSNLCKKLSKCFNSDCNIINEYGPTEATVGCTYYVYQNNDEGVLPIGQPIYNTKALIFADNKVVYQNKKQGELLIGGDSVFDGYSDIDIDCFYKIDGEKYYRTGDIAYIDNQNIYYVDRIDNQVKIKGNRVELDEIKNCINNINGVVDSIVLYEDNLYAFVINKSKIKDQDIIDKLKEKFPSYMIPKKIYFLKEFPILDGGKIDKKQLLQKIDKNIKIQNIENNDVLLDLLVNVKSDVLLDKNKSLFDLGLESFDIISYLQLIVDNFIDEENEEKFMANVLERINDITLIDIEKIIINFGGKI